MSLIVIGTGDLVSSLTSTFDQKLRTLNNSSPLDDGSIPYADEAQGEEESGSGSPSPSGGEERVSPAARAHELKAAWLARDHRHSSSSSDDADARWQRPCPVHYRKPFRSDDDSEKENCEEKRAESSADEKDVDTRSQASAEVMPDNDVALYKDSTENNKDETAKLKRSESLNRSPERRVSRVLRSESLNCRAPRSDSLGLTKLEKGEWNVVRRAGGARSTKLKRKNGMPERGIKRRHTVGGTKDFDKDGWSARHTRTSSPDLTAGVWPTPLVPPPRPPLESHV